MSNQEKQILVMKGWEGFADRLQALSHCLQYCIVNNAAICVDWRDHMWGQQKMDFSDYFEIINIPVVSIEQVLERISAGATISPVAYKKQDIIAEPNESIHFKCHNAPFNESYKKVDADIVVNNSKGIRTWHIDNIICNLRLKKSISDIICARLACLETPYTVIHLRGTDRLSNIMPKDVVKTMQQNMDSQAPHVRARQYIVSDMKILIDAWMEKQPEARVLYDKYAVHKLPTGTQGTHQLSEPVLEFYGITKHDMNIDTLTDFLLVCFADWAFGNCGESLFLKMGKFIHQSGKRGLANWLHGFVPIVAPLKPLNLKTPIQDYYNCD